MSEAMPDRAEKVKPKPDDMSVTKLLTDRCK